MMIKDIDLNLDCNIRCVPHALRARGWRLYTEKGRLIDLWQYGGRAILGHNPPGMLRAIKNNAERGLYVPHPHFAEGRLYKALAALLPGRSFRVYENEAFLNLAVNHAQLEPALWRPFMDKESQNRLQSEPVLLPVLPCPLSGAPAVLAIDTEQTPAKLTVPVKLALEQLPPSQVISPVALGAATRCIYDLIAATDRGNPRLQKVDKAVKKSSLWKRKGIYLYYTGTAENYSELFQCFLNGGFLLPPTIKEPAILPGELSAGEEAKLAVLLQ
ncbi:MAG: hypothetical protein FWG07_03625 [Treponema sp.]|nr:hypothetical protein [Treponema sp.]